MSKLRIERAVLVYQAGLANVFSVEAFNMSDYGRDAKRLIQSDFDTCEAFARGLAAAGTKIVSVHCNETGDVANRTWNEELEQAPFCDSFRPVFAQMTPPMNVTDRWYRDSVEA